MYIYLQQYGIGADRVVPYADRVYYSLTYKDLHTWDFSGWGNMDYGLTNWNLALKTVMVF